MTYEPPLDPFCRHLLVAVGEPYQEWTSSNVCYPSCNQPPDGCPIRQKFRCTKCGGFGIFCIEDPKRIVEAE